MTKEKELSREILTFWENASKANLDVNGLRPTARDPYLQIAVEDVIERYLWNSAKVLDIGCGDGMSSLRFAQNVAEVLGVDYVDGFVRLAEKNAQTKEVCNAHFSQQDVLELSNLNETSEPFDIAVSIRCLINLPSWDLQSRALKEIAAVIRPGGLYMCSEGWQDGWDELNLARERTGLSPMAVVSYNKLIRRSDFEAEAGKYFEIINYQSLGLYLFLSRVFQPNFVKPEEPSHTHDINRVAMELQNSMKTAHYFPDCDYAGVYILKRK